MTTRAKHDPCSATRSPRGGSLQSLWDRRDKEAGTLAGAGERIRGPMGPSWTGIAGQYSTGHLRALMTRTCTFASDILVSADHFGRAFNGRTDLHIDIDESPSAVIE